MSLRTLLLGALLGGAAFFYSRRAAASGGFLMTASSYKPPAAAAPYLAAIHAAEDRVGIPRNLLTRLIQQESAFNPRAVNTKSGATGLAQIMAATARDPGYGVRPITDRTNAAESIRFAADYLAAMKRLLGSWQLALAAYNWGPGYVQKNPTNRAAWPVETQRYVAQITASVPVA